MFCMSSSVVCVWRLIKVCPFDSRQVNELTIFMFCRKCGVSVERFLVFNAI